MFLKERIFSFISMAYPGDTFAVVSFDAKEGLSELYRVELIMAAKETSLDFNDILDSPAHCVLRGRERVVTLHGVVAELEQLHHVNEYVFYRVVLVPKLWWLTLITHNQVFLNKTVPQVLEQVLQDGGLTSLDYEFRLQQEYPARELICQYNETHYHFFMRWLEREGLYYYFDRHDDNTRLVITDTHIAHKDVHRHKEVLYSPPSGLQPSPDDEVVHSFVCRQGLTPRTIQLRDYNDQTPSLDIRTAHQVAETGRGVSYRYGDHILTPAEGRRLALINAEASKVQALRYAGTSTLGSLRSGFIFSLKNHYRPDFNREYTVTRCRHQGNQSEYLVAGLRKALEGFVEEGPVYGNEFEAIPADMQYRSPRRFEKPRINGTLPAKIDAAGDGTYAELDGQGRYTVILPFDLSGRKDGKASCRLRLVQPYAGSGHGMHFPLHKGAEVLLTFIDGDPDQPVIAGAVPNAEAPSQVTSSNQTMSKIATAGGNVMHFEDKQDAARVLMSTPQAKSWFRMGAPNDPPPALLTEEPPDPPTDPPEVKDGWEDPKKNEDGFAWSTEGSWNSVIGQHMEVKVGGNSTELIIGGEEVIVGGFHNYTVVGAKTDITMGALAEFLLAYVLEISLSGKLAVVSGVHFEVNAALHSEFRPECVKVEERALHFNNADTEIHELKAELHNAVSRISDSEDAIRMAYSDINESRTEISTTRRTIADNDTRLRQSINDVLNEKFQIIESSICMLNDKLECGEEDLEVFSEYLNSAEFTAFL